MGLFHREYGIFDNLTEQWLIAEFEDGSAMWTDSDDIDWEDDGPMVFNRKRDAQSHIDAMFTETDMLSVERVA